MTMLYTSTQSSKENGEQVYSESWSVVDNISHPEAHLVESGDREERQEGDGMLVMEALRTYTPDAITSDEGEEEEDGGERVNEEAKAEVERIRFEKKLQPYPISPSALSTVSQPRTGSVSTFSSLFYGIISHTLLSITLTLCCSVTYVLYVIDVIYLSTG